MPIQWRDLPRLANAYLAGALKLDEYEYATSTIQLTEVNPGLARLAAGEDICAVLEL